MTMAGLLKKGQEYYSLAATTAKNIIDNSGLYLTESYAELWKEANKEQANEVMFAIHHNAKLKTASNYGKSYYPADFIPAGCTDYYGNEAFYLNYPDDERKAWNYMTEWNTKSTMSLTKRAVTSYLLSRNITTMIMAHRVVASLPTVSPASIVMPKSC